jgi:hypothetical protein
MAKKQKKIKGKRPAVRAVAEQSTQEPRGLNNWQQALIFGCVALVVAAFLHFSAETFPDPDVFYHFRHAAIYANPGELLRTSFPWVRYSVISEFSSDLWYGFHLLLVPFTFGRDPIVGMQLAGVFVTCASLILFYAACVHLEIKAAPFWPFFLLFSSAFLLHRFGMLRPQVTSLGLGALLFALLAIGSVWGVFSAALASTFLHLNFFFISFMILGVFACVRTLIEKSFPWRECLALTSGVLIGWMLRPNPIGAAKILYVQLFQLSQEKLSGGLVDIAAEMLPLKLKANSNYLLLLLLWLSSLLCVLWGFFQKNWQGSKRDRTVLFATVSLSAIFFFMSVLFARRAFDFCSTFGVILIGLVFSRYLYESWSARIVLASAFIFLVPYGLNLRNEVLSEGWNPARFEGASKWTAERSNPGDIVFNARWEYFPELFFWNIKNVYSNGMDPIFQYAYDPDLYRESHYLVADQMPPEGPVDVYAVLKNKFKARFVVLARAFDGSFYFRLASDSRFSLQYEDHNAAVFEVN